MTPDSGPDVYRSKPKDLTVSRFDFEVEVWAVEGLWWFIYLV